MEFSKRAKAFLFSLAYGINLILALLLYLAGEDGNIMLGILLIVLYRPSLWFTPLLVTIICWLPSRPKLSAKTKILNNLVQLMLTGALFHICFFLFGNWY